MEASKHINGEEIKAVLDKRENERKKEYVSIETGVKNQITETHRDR